jgi:RNA polymerase sigma-70 factor (ECF subfamily)
VTTRAEVEQVFREQHGKVLAVLTRSFGDLQAAEDALQDAFLIALDAWPRLGAPDRPAAWITAVARNRARSGLRHQAVVEEKHRAIAEQAAREAELAEAGDIPDERLRLLFTCCHPALAEEARVALALHALCGLPTPAIARLFLVPEATLAQRLVRAKRKIREARIPYEVPPAERVEERLEAVLAVVYLLFTEGYFTSDGAPLTRVELCDEAIRLGRLLVQLLPGHAEARGLLALMLLHHARAAARTDAQGDTVELEAQDRARWDRAAIGEGTRLLDQALARGEAGRYQIQAAIAALHCMAARAEQTDWPQIAALYRELWRSWPSPSVALNLAVAEGMADGPERGLARLAELERDGTLAEADRVPAARADLLRRAGRTDEARACYRAAIARARNPREARFLERRMASCGSAH